MARMMLAFIRTAWPARTVSKLEEMSVDLGAAFGGQPEYRVSYSYIGTYVFPHLSGLA